MNSSLHPDARGLQPDMAAFLYASLRLPACIVDVERVIMGQSVDVFRSRGIGDIERWERVHAGARRRRTHFDGAGTLASFIASGSDIDDLIPILTAFQIEWNKLHLKLRGEQVKTFLAAPRGDEEGLAVLALGTGIDIEDLKRLQEVWGEDFFHLLQAVSSGQKGFKVLLLSGSLNDYRRATDMWWENVESKIGAIDNRRVYFVSSNTHSLVNLVSGFANRHEKTLIDFIHQADRKNLLSEWQAIQAQNVPSSRENFLYYALKKFLASEQGADYREMRMRDEQQCGIARVLPQHSFDIETQIIDLSRLQQEWVDPRLCCPDFDRLAESDALVINIDYPLGMAAYLILSDFATRVAQLEGVYVIGKAATLNGRIGDVMIPSVVHDEHSQNTYLFHNCFRAQHVADDLVYGTVLDNQKTVTVRGTFLQTPRYMDVFYQEGYTDIEMEAGPYLSAVYELYRPIRHPENEIVNLHGLPFELGILHYASDTPLSKGRSLGSGSLSYFGMDPTYASSLAVMRRILQNEILQMG
jgi:hypothetical protein